MIAPDVPTPSPPRSAPALRQDRAGSSAPAGPSRGPSFGALLHQARVAPGARRRSESRADQPDRREDQSSPAEPNSADAVAATDRCAGNAACDPLHPPADPTLPASVPAPAAGDPAVSAAIAVTPTQASLQDRVDAPANADAAIRSQSSYGAAVRAESVANAFNSTAAPVGPSVQTGGEFAAPSGQATRPPHLGPGAPVSGNAPTPAAIGSLRVPPGTGALEDPGTLSVPAIRSPRSAPGSLDAGAVVDGKPGSVDAGAAVNGKQADPGAVSAFAGGTSEAAQAAMRESADTVPAGFVNLQAEIGSAGESPSSGAAGGGVGNPGVAVDQNTDPPASWHEHTPVSLYRQNEHAPDKAPGQIADSGAPASSEATPTPARTEEAAKAGPEDATVALPGQTVESHAVVSVKLQGLAPLAATQTAAPPAKTREGVDGKTAAQELLMPSTPVAALGPAPDPAGAAGRDGGNREHSREKAADPIGHVQETAAPLPAGVSPSFAQTLEPAAAASVAGSTAGAAPDHGNLMRQVAGHIDRMHLSAAGHGEMSLSLTPEHLGSLRLTIASDGNGVVARIVVETALARQAIEGAKDQLRAALENRGLNLASLDVSLNQGGAGHNPFARQDPPSGETGERREWRPAASRSVPAPPEVSAPAAAPLKATLHWLDYRA